MTTVSRGDYINGGEYKATGIYLNDNFSFTKWLTLSAGARYGKYTSSGSEVLPLVGKFDAHSDKSNLTSSFNAVVHSTRTINFVANYLRGYRAPNMHDMTSFTLNSLFLIIPNAGLEAERMRSVEGGVKYDAGRLSGSAFYFRNRLSNLLVQSSGTFLGKPFVDFNHNGVRNAGEPVVRVTTNIGHSTVKGYELELRYLATSNLTLWGNYARTIGTNDTAALVLSRIQPRLANLGARLSANGGHGLWTEGTLMYGSDYVGTNGIQYPGFHVYTVRAGASLTPRVSLILGIENLLDQKYRFAPDLASLDQPGRQAVVAAEFNF